MTSQSLSPPPSSSSDAFPMPRHPSPLAHSAHSPEEVASPSSVRSAPLPSQSMQSVRSRGGSVSTIRPLVTSPVITRVVSTPVSHSLSSSTATLGPGPPDFRSRSLSPQPACVLDLASPQPRPGPVLALAVQERQGRRRQRRLGQLVDVGRGHPASLGREAQEDGPRRAGRGLRSNP